jgi:hypothetical protein
MAQFTVRIELHDARWDDYTALHSAMEQIGFTRHIRGDNGRTYRLPWAEYNGFGNLSCVQVRNIAQEVANQTGKKNSVLVTEAVSRAWSGLQVA